MATDKKLHIYFQCLLSEESSVFVWLDNLYKQVHVAGEEKFYIFAPGKYKVGRKGTSIVLVVIFDAVLLLLNDKFYGVFLVYNEI